MQFPPEFAASVGIDEKRSKFVRVSKTILTAMGPGADTNHPNRIRLRNARTRWGYRLSGESLWHSDKAYPTIRARRLTVPMALTLSENGALMKTKVLFDEPEAQVHLVVLDSGEEAFGTLTRFADQQCIGSASITAIGAFERAVVG